MEKETDLYDSNCYNSCGKSHEKGGKKEGIPI